MSEQVPSIGRVVHFIGTNGKHYPADVCDVREDGSVVLFVKDSSDESTYFVYGPTYDPTAEYVVTWHWPEYVPAKAAQQD